MSLPLPLHKGDVGNPIHNTQSKNAAVNFSASNAPTRFTLLWQLEVTARKLGQQGEPCWSIGCGEIGSSSFALCIMNRISNVPLLMLKEAIRVCLLPDLTCTDSCVSGHSVEEASTRPVLQRHRRQFKKQIEQVFGFPYVFKGPKCDIFFLFVFLLFLLRRG